MKEEIKMEIQVSAIGAIVGLVIAITLIFKKVPPVYSLMIGSLIGGLTGGIGLVDTVTLMIEGAQGMMTAILRILAAGVLAGVLIETRAAESIAQSIIAKIGRTRSLLALAISTLMLTAVGVFVDIAVITVAPIALIIARDAKISRPAILLAMIGGGKAGNVMSPNPNTIAVSEAFSQPLTSVMLAGVIPGILSLVVTYYLSKRIAKISETTDYNLDDLLGESDELPGFIPAISGPIIAVILLSLRPLFDINVDPMVALPLGGIIGSFVMKKHKGIVGQIEYGLSKMSNVAILLIGTGTIAGIISNSTLGELLTEGIANLGLPVYLLAPISGILMSAATASTTSGSIVASSVFSTTLLESGVGGLAGAAMIHAGATVLDHLPHGSFYHATGGSVSLGFKQRLRIIPYETLIGLTITIISVLMFGLFG